MQTVFTIAFILVLLGVAYFIGRIQKRRKKILDFHTEAQSSFRSRVRKIFELISPVLIPLEKGESPSEELIQALAKDPKTRYYLYEGLKSFGKESLFPLEYVNHQSSAESQLVYHLLHIHKLGKEPDVIQFEEKIKLVLEGNSFDYYAFRYKMNAPHSLSEKGWFRGVCGPFVSEAPPYSRGMATHGFVDENVDNRTAKEHAEWAHVNKLPETVNWDKVLQRRP